jgi:hypothetical protein
MRTIAEMEMTKHAIYSADGKAVIFMSDSCYAANARGIGGGTSWGPSPIALIASRSR